MTAHKLRYSILLTLLILCTVCQKQIFIEYGVGQQGWQLYKLFYDVQDGFYVDVGAYDSIYASNTLNLYTKGWGGINIDASPSRLQRFFLLRPDQTNLNYAIGDQNTYVTLYQLDQDSSSTVSQKVKQYVKTTKPVVAQIKIPSLSLKQICQRYYYKNKKPLFLNVDIQGYGSKAFQGNNWSNPMCVPDVILSQINQESTQSGLPLPAQILIKYGYKRVPKIIGLNQMFIHSTVYQTYMEKYKAAQQKINDYQMVGIQQVSTSLTRKIKSSTTLFKHYQPTSDYLYFKFTKSNQIIDLLQLNDESNRLTSHTRQNRQIVILHFNPKTSVIVIKQGIWTMTELPADSNFYFYQIVVTKNDGKKFRAFILDHHFLNTKGLKPKIIDGIKQSYLLQQTKCYTSPLSNLTLQPISNITYTPQQQKQLQTIKKATAILVKQLRNQTQLLSRINQGQKNQSEQLKNTFLQNHNIQINILERISMKMNNNQRLLSKQNPKKSQVQNNLNRKIKNINTQLKSLRTVQSVTIGMIGVMVLSLSITCCIVRSRNKKNKYYGNLDDRSVTEIKISS